MTYHTLTFGGPADTVAGLWPAPSPLLFQIRALTGPRHAGQLLPFMGATGSSCLPDWGCWVAGWVSEWKASWCLRSWWPRSTSTHPASTQTCWRRCNTWWSPGSSCCFTSTRSSAEVRHRHSFFTVKTYHFEFHIAVPPSLYLSYHLKHVMMFSYDNIMNQHESWINPQPAINQISCEKLLLGRNGPFETQAKRHCR